MGTIKVSMNGARRNLSNEIKRLRDIVKDVVSGGYYEDEDLIKVVDELICQSNTLNCIWIEGDPDFKEMGDLNVELIGDYD